MFTAVTVRATTCLLVTMLLAIGVTACGRSGSKPTSSVESPATVVAKVGAARITQAQVSHEMTVIAGLDYYTASDKRVLPTGLLSQPPDITACATRLRGLAAASPRGTSGLTQTSLIKQCGEFNDVIRRQAVTALVQAQWLTSLAEELGITVTSAEVRKLHRRLSTELYASQASLSRYLTHRRMTLADLFLEDRLDLVAQKTLKLVENGGQSAYKRVIAMAQKWSEKTTCTPGYIVAHCREYAVNAAQSAQANEGAHSPAIERVVAAITGFCSTEKVCGQNDAAAQQEELGGSVQIIP